MCFRYRVYVKQAFCLKKSLDDSSFAAKIYSTLGKVEGSGAESAKYAHLATSQNFLFFMELNFDNVNHRQLLLSKKMLTIG